MTVKAELAEGRKMIAKSCLLLKNFHNLKKTLAVKYLIWIGVACEFFKKQLQGAITGHNAINF
ncbi:hypothetical protein ACTXT7_014023 [Hymenolepis weldensis]